MKRKDVSDMPLGLFIDFTSIHVLVQFGSIQINQYWYINFNSFKKQFENYYYPLNQHENTVHENILWWFIAL